MSFYKVNPMYSGSVNISELTFSTLNRGLQNCLYESQVESMLSQYIKEGIKDLDFPVTLLVKEKGQNICALDALKNGLPFPLLIAVSLRFFKEKNNLQRMDITELQLLKNLFNLILIITLTFMLMCTHTMKVMKNSMKL